MIKLINGRGQLGQELKKQINLFEKEINENIFIYHTWNIDDKSQQTQKNEYEKFLFFVDQNRNSRIIFTSTYSTKENWYNHYKQLAAAYLITNCTNGLVVRIPTIIGKGAVEKLKAGKIVPYGKFELITLQRAAKEIINFLNYKGLIKIFTLEGEKISATTVKSLLEV